MKKAFWEYAEGDRVGVLVGTRILRGSIQRMDGLLATVSGEGFSVQAHAKSLFPDFPATMTKTRCDNGFYIC